MVNVVEKKFSAGALTANYVVIQWFYRICCACLVGFCSVFLLEGGFTNTQIGIVLAIASVISAVLQPVLASYIDKPNGPSVKNVLIVLCVIQVILCIFVVLLHGAFVAGLFFGGCVIFLNTIDPLLNSLCVETINQGKKMNFGIGRGMGSLAYAIASLVLGKFVSGYGVMVLPITIIIFYIAMVVALLIFPFKKMDKTAGSAKTVSQRSPLQFFTHYKKFTVLLVGMTLVYTSYMFLNTYCYQVVVDKGGGSSEMGVLFFILALFELPTMMLFGFMLKLARSNFWLKASGIFFVAKSLGMFLAPGMMSCYAVQVFQMFGFALLTVASVYYVNDIMEPQDTVKGQAYALMTYTLGNVFATLIGGILLDSIGVSGALLTVTVVAAIGMFIMFFSTQKTKI